MLTDKATFKPDADNLSEAHRDYRRARLLLGIPEHDKFFKLACTHAGFPVTLDQAKLDSEAMDSGVKRKRNKEFSAPLYVTAYVGRILKGEVDLQTRAPCRPEMIVDDFPSSEKQRRGLASVSGSLAAANVRNAAQTPQLAATTR